MRHIVLGKFKVTFNLKNTIMNVHVVFILMAVQIVQFSVLYSCNTQYTSKGHYVTTEIYLPHRNIHTLSFLLSNQDIGIMDNMYLEIRKVCKLRHVDNLAGQKK